jgi:TPR repeat protein
LAFRYVGSGASVSNVSAPASDTQSSLQLPQMAAEQRNDDAVAIGEQGEAEDPVIESTMNAKSEPDVSDANDGIDKTAAMPSVQPDMQSAIEVSDSAVPAENIETASSAKPETVADAEAAAAVPGPGAPSKIAGQSDQTALSGTADLAVLTLASRLENGAGMGRDYNESALWYTRAATSGSSLAMMKLADWARRGRGMTRDDALSVRYYRQAAEAGHPDGAWEAARAYLEGGRGVAADEATGMTLLRQAARLGTTSAIEELQRRGG